MRKMDASTYGTLWSRLTRSVVPNGPEPVDATSASHTSAHHHDSPPHDAGGTLITPPHPRHRHKRTLAKANLSKNFLRLKRTGAAMNPSHILIARGSRGHNPSAALSSPTETHAAASGIFRNNSQLPSQQARASAPPSGSSIGHHHSHSGSRSGGTSGQWLMEDSDVHGDEEEEEGSESGKLEEVQIDPTFTRAGRFPGSVKIIVEGTTFWAHRDILVFASPFFEAALSGDWSETRVDDQSILSSRRRSVASVITIPQLPNNPSDRASRDTPTNVAPSTSFESSDTFSSPGSTPVARVPAEKKEKEDDSDAEDFANEIDDDIEDLGDKSKMEGEDNTEVNDPEERDKVRDMSLHQLEGRGFGNYQRATATAKIVLREEKASIFHDFLKFIYPHLDCSITWNNVEGLMNISSKLCVPGLTKHCLTFLLTHAAGKPIKAMRIAEIFEEEHLFRESSRFVLDNPGGWSDNELNTLSQETLLKLEKRRNWFLERILKLGVTNIAKDYQCCATCPDSSTCARLLDEKWRQAYNACFRFGPCQPSIVYRYLRGLEGVTPPLALTHLACQTHAKAFTTSLFDRMFSLGVRGSGSGADPAPLAARVPGVQGPGAGPRRHFLYCSLNS